MSQSWTRRGSRHIGYPWLPYSCLTQKWEPLRLSKSWRRAHLSPCPISLLNCLESLYRINPILYLISKDKDEDCVSFVLFCFSLLTWPLTYAFPILGKTKHTSTDTTWQARKACCGGAVKQDDVTLDKHHVAENILQLCALLEPTLVGESCWVEHQMI